MIDLKKTVSAGLCLLLMALLLVSCHKPTPTVTPGNSTPSFPESGTPSSDTPPVEEGCPHHNTKKVADKDPTCIVEGYADRLKCKDCQQVLDTTGRILPALGHQYKNRKCVHCAKFEPDVTVEGTFEGTETYWKLYSDGELEIGGSGKTPDFDENENSYFYRYNKAVTSIVVYDGVTRIGDNLCRVLKEAKTISIASSVTEIGDHAFEGWELSKLYLSMRLERLGKDNFTCNKLFFLELPGTLVSVGSGCFESTQLITLRVPASVKTFETVKGQFQSLENLAYMGTEAQFMRLDLGKHMKVDGKCALVNVLYEFKDEARSLPYCTQRGLKDGDFTYIVYSDKTARVSKYSGSSKDLVIPEKFGVYTVTGIHTTCFEENKSIAKVTLPKTVKTVAREAFLNSSLSTLVILGDELKIADFAFSGCVQLTALEMEGTFLDVGHGAFGATHVSNFKLSPKMDAVRASAFAQTEIVISDFTQFDYIGDSAFAYTSLKHHLNLKGVKEIGFGAFYRASATSADVTGVERIEAYAFYLNGNLTTETVKGLDTVKTVDPAAFDFKLS
ncbi:MAG: leucine-rich repeat domain-containing protein [Clostridia bacterium]|nr:leucine-rich repeat domain-containing protein [Clostridia bacterium]